MTNATDLKPKLSRKEQKAIAQQRLRETGKLCVETKVKAKKGQKSLQEINDRVCAASDVSEIFSDMKILMTSVATAKGYIKKGQSKIRKGGSPDDFLNYVTIKMCERWKKQKDDDLINGEYGKTRIENWCAYANIVIYTLLNEYNRSVVDFNFSQMPTQRDKDGEETEIEYENPKALDELECFMLKELITPATIKQAIDQLPEDLKWYMLDSLFYILYGKFLDPSKKNFAIVGAKMLKRSLSDGD